MQQSRAIAAPKGTPAEVIDELQAAVKKAFEAEAYKEFNTSSCSPPTRSPARRCDRVDRRPENYRGKVEKYGIELGGDQ